LRDLTILLAPRSMRWHISGSSYSSAFTDGGDSLTAQQKAVADYLEVLAAARGKRAGRFRFAGDRPWRGSAV